MEIFNWQIWSDIWEAREFKRGNKMVKHLQYQGQELRPRYLVQWGVQSKPQFKKYQRKLWKRQRKT